MIRESHFDRLVRKNLLEEKNKEQKINDNKDSNFNTKPRTNISINNDYNNSETIYHPENTFPKTKNYDTGSNVQVNLSLKTDVNDSKPYNSSRKEIISAARRKKSKKSTSIQYISKSKERRFKMTDDNLEDEIYANKDEAEIKTIMMLRVKEEMSMKHAQTYNFLKKWFKKIFINGSNSQDKFFDTFKDNLNNKENLFFLCFGESKSGKTFSIQGNKINY